MSAVPGQPRLLFLSLANDPGSDRIVAAMGRHGARCGVIGAANAFAARSRFATDLFPLPRLANYLPENRFLSPRLREIASGFRPDLIIPLDDLAARVLRDARFYQNAGPEFEALLERSLGALEFRNVGNRQAFADEFSDPHSRIER